MGENFNQQSTPPNNDLPSEAKISPNREKEPTSPKRNTNLEPIVIRTRGTSPIRKKIEIDFYMNDQTNFLISEAWLTELETQSNFKVVKKLGEGTFNIAVLSRSRVDNNLYVLLVNKNTHCEDNITPPDGTALIASMQKEGKLNTSKIVQVYDQFLIKDIPLTEDPRYCSKLLKLETIVQVEEYIEGITLDEKIFNMSKYDFNEKVKFLLELRVKIVELLDYIRSKGLRYFDLQSTNLMLRNSEDLDSLVFIDVDSFQTRSKDMIVLRMSEEELDVDIKEDLAKDLLGVMLVPLTEEEIEEENYIVYRQQKKKAKLFNYAEIGPAFGLILAKY
jgi:hypothetical protein